MAVPKQKHSKSRTRTRRSHNDKVQVKGSVLCQCGEGLRRPHHVCMHCGQYRGRQLVPVVSE